MNAKFLRGDANNLARHGTLRVLCYTIVKKIGQKWRPRTVNDVPSEERRRIPPELPHVLGSDEQGRNAPNSETEEAITSVIAIANKPPILVLHDLDKSTPETQVETEERVAIYLSQLWTENSEVRIRGG